MSVVASLLCASCYFLYGFCFFLVWILVLLLSLTAFFLLFIGTLTLYSLPRRFFCAPGHPFFCTAVRASSLAYYLPDTAVDLFVLIFFLFFSLASFLFPGDTFSSPFFFWSTIFPPRGVFPQPWGACGRYVGGSVGNTHTYVEYICTAILLYCCTAVLL